MKKVILAAIAVMAFGFANAQDVKFGLKGGINLSSFSGDIEDASSKVGFQVGGFAEFKLTDKFSIQPELLYSTQGAKFEESEVNYFYKEKINTNYLNVPVMAKYYVASKFSVEAGPQIGFLLSAKDKWEEMYYGEKNSGTDDAKDDIKSVSFGLNVGAGYDFTENVSVGVRYNFGLSNISDFDSDAKIHNNVVSLSVGYKF
ncbi:porin family protein [Flavobacterium sp. S87F.05.LMB.W.Kidney.N]|uniref:porin family protein n=1 Tax=Flavobacterium sp. S87F.05.LMB.W.Kidney.N TaxID=1278758 RepID=UPI0010669519|nr:porin family protein [Flavobacterium sp. S87F.05.LMB.W.Kidney.N]TDX09484.1 putative outer membrane protein [Flavobacterium sp. S87F.05.LMB.W.Kidney.N]